MNFTACDMDMARHYRPRMNVVQRPTLGTGRGYEITGHHELMVPMLAWAVAERLAGRERKADAGGRRDHAPEIVSRIFRALSGLKIRMMK